MMIQENAPVGGKTTMRIGGNARYFANVKTKEDVEKAAAFAMERNVPLIVLGGGSNTVFADGTIEALVVRIGHDALTVEANSVRVGSGKILASLVNDLAVKNLDLSPLTGIPGTVGGAIFGNAGQGHGGVWIGNFIDTVEFFYEGRWQTMTKAECDFRYRESGFKDMDRTPPPIIWETTMTVPSRPSIEVLAEVDRLIKKRIETQPHLKTAGSCFKSLPDGTPAWKLIDAAGLRGKKIGDVQVAEKHANFLLNTGKATFEDAVAMVTEIKKSVPQIAGVEMRFIKNDGATAF